MLEPRLTMCQTSTLPSVPSLQPLSVQCPDHMPEHGPAIFGFGSQPPWPLPCPQGSRGRGGMGTELEGTGGRLPPGDARPARELAVTPKLKINRPPLSQERNGETDPSFLMGELLLHLAEGSASQTPVRVGLKQGLTFSHVRQPRHRGICMGSEQN